jgi:dTDP-glucose 4,6-dehydratase
MWTVLVTGGAGFIGSALCRRLVGRPRTRVVNVDKLTYAGNLAALQAIAGRSNYRFYRADISDEHAMLDIMTVEQVDTIINLAAETHVDRSIDGPQAFVQTNVVGTSRLLTASLLYWNRLPPERRAAFRYLQVSTDEVFGDLPLTGGRFTETSPYAPRSPYAASKAAADQLVGAWHATYGFPALISHASNTYGPYQFPEKLVPVSITNALDGRPIRLYGDGTNVRDWLHVEDHVAALELIATTGQSGERYVIGGSAERSNLAIATAICDALDAVRPLRRGSYRDLITFVADRPGHDRRYALDPARIETELGWRRTVDLDSGLPRTVNWYARNEAWWRAARITETPDLFAVAAE